MIKNKYNVVALMSGTSLDGIDLIYVTFYFNEKWRFTIQNATTIPYNNYWNETLKSLIKKSKEDLREIDEFYTEYLSEVIHKFISENNIKDIDFISSHGHTALHQPENHVTYQIGNLPVLAKLINEKVVCDFRVEDVELGGQGAPLVPIGDKLLFSEYDFCLNLGGFANISTHIKGSTIAYDICPVNIILNHYARLLGFEFDNKGEIAERGLVDEKLLLELNELEYYKLPYPKSLGLEWVKNKMLSRFDHYNLKEDDILRTSVEHMAIQISNEINKKRNAKVLITGGGVYNDFLIKQIKLKTKNKIIIPPKTLINYKEALIFGLLGVLKMRNEINCLSSVTGAKHDHSSGKIYYPENN